MSPTRQGPAASSGAGKCGQSGYRYEGHNRHIGYTKGCTFGPMPQGRQHFKPYSGNGSKGLRQIVCIQRPGHEHSPDLSQKVQIIENAVGLARALDYDNPKVAVVCAVEKVNPKMPATLDAEELVKMNQQGRISGCVVGGPFALDNAVSVEAARHKGIDHPVAGNADILIMPDIEAGNILYKSLVYFAGAKCAGLVVGAKIPIVVTSRADNEEDKLNSIALAVLLANR